MFRSVMSRLATPSLLTNVQKANHFVVKTYANGRPLIEKGLNQVLLMGRCGTDPVQRGSEARPVVIFSLATHSHYKVKETDQFQQKTDWHRISVFRTRLIEKTLNFAKKGSRLFIQGRLSYGELTDANGVTHQTTSIIAEDIIFLSKTRDSEELDEDNDEAIES